jgi:membrane-bound lytic murein transglycosylase D
MLTWAPVTRGSPAPSPLPTSPHALRADSRDGPEVDDPEVEEKVQEDSAALEEVHDAEVKSEATPEDDAGIPDLPEIDGDIDALQAEYDIPVVVNAEVIRYVRFYQSAEVRPHFVRWLSRSHRYAPRLRQILRGEGLPEDTIYLAMVESGFGNRATSAAHAVGPWQFLASTARQFGLRRDSWVDERRDPEKAARAAARFLRDLYRRTGNWHLAWAAYNAGPGRIARAQRLGYVGFWEMARADGVLPGETRAYVPKIIAAAIIAKHAEAFGFGEDEVQPERWIEYEQVHVRRATPLSALAEAAGVSVADLLDLNPELRRTRTPPRRYVLRIPVDRASAFAERWPRMARQAAREIAKRRLARTPAKVAARTVRVRPGDSLWSLSRRYGVTVRELARWNGIRRPRRHTLLAGRELVVEWRRSRPRHGDDS